MYLGLIDALTLLLVAFSAVTSILTGAEARNNIARASSMHISLAKLLVTWFERHVLHWRKRKINTAYRFFRRYVKNVIGTWAVTSFMALGVLFDKSFIGIFSTSELKSDSIALITCAIGMFIVMIIYIDAKTASSDLKYRLKNLRVSPQYHYRTNNTPDSVDRRTSINHRTPRSSSQIRILQSTNPTSLSSAQLQELYHARRNADPNYVRMLPERAKEEFDRTWGLDPDVETDHESRI